MPKADYQEKVSAAKENVTSVPNQSEGQEKHTPEETTEDTRTTIDSQPADSEQKAKDMSQEPTQTIRNPTVSTESPETVADQTPRTVIVSTNREKGLQPYVATPAKLAENSRAAAAQRLSDQPDKVAPGFYYEATHRRLHEPGWHFKMHIKRKNLHLSNLRVKGTERIGLKWVILPMGIGVMLLVVLGATLLTSFTAMSNATNERYQSQVVTLADVLPQDNLKMYDASGHLLYQAIDQGVQTSEPLDKISPYLQSAEIDMEDQSFWQNSGYDITGIVRAAISDLSSGHVVAGGSTITQQLIKNAIVGNEDTALRKLEEIELAPEVTRYYTKQQLLDMYLNTVYYANGAYGSEAAAQVYFGLQDKPGNPASNQLDLAQAATLAGIPSNPDLRNPIAYPQNSLIRTQQVLQQMYRMKTITLQQYTAALKEIQKPGFASYHAPVQNPQAVALSSFTNYALTELADDLHVKVSDLSRSGLSVTTTLDSNLQTRVLKEAQHDIAAIKAAHNISDSSVVMINPQTGAIETLIGNIDPEHNAFNVATQGFRQAGSTMKAFTYVTAFEHGVSPGAQTYDEPETFYYNGVAYRPDNYAGVHHGWITYREALDWSLNIDAVRLELSPQVGVQNDYEMAENLGLGPTNGVVNETFTLGALGVHLLNETSAYSTFANGGVHVPAHAINTVTNAQGKVIYRAPTTGKRIITPQAAYILTNVLSDNATRDKEFFPCDALDLYVNNKCGGTVIPAAVKTGTTDDFVDNLTIGYTPSLVTAVWSGNDDNSPMNNIIGITGAGTIWHDAMMTALQGKPIQQFTNPGGVIYSPIYHDMALAH
jgi:penicillin-binding protein 1A